MTMTTFVAIGIGLISVALNLIVAMKIEQGTCHIRKGLDLLTEEVKRKQ